MSTSNGIERIEGPPQLETPGRERRLEVSCGDGFQASTSVGNHGGGFEGLRIEVTGSAVSEGLVEIESIGVHGGAAQERTDLDAERVDEEGTRHFVAVFRDVELAAALAGEVDFAEMSDERGREVMRAHRGSRASIYISGRAIEAGDGELCIELAPIEAPERRVGEEAHLTVFPTARRPLASEEEPPAHTLRQMAKDETLFGLVHFDAPVGAWADEATEAMGRWNDLIAGGDDRYIRVEVESRGTRPDEDEVAASAFDEQGLAELARRLPELDQYSVLLSGAAMNEGRMQPHRSGGFSYFSCAGALAGGGEPAPALGFWLGVDDRSPRDVERLRTELAAMLDRLAESGHLVQGVLDSWAWAPALKIRSLPYEIVCGLQSSAHLRCGWLKRHLRAVTPQMWLGGGLVERLDREKLETCAETTDFEGGLRVQLRPDSGLPALEEVLAPVVAGEDEWRAEADS